MEGFSASGAKEQVMGKNRVRFQAQVKPSGLLWVLPPRESKNVTHTCHFKVLLLARGSRSVQPTTELTIKGLLAGSVLVANGF